MTDTVTDGIRIVVHPRYVAEASEPSKGRWVFAYQVNVHNQSDAPVQLLSRTWVITNGDGHVETVRGPGVVGQQPVIAPGETFRYTSGCPLPTPVGTMHGAYEMQRLPSGARFEAQIAPFRLAVPGLLN